MTARLRQFSASLRRLPTELPAHVAQLAAPGCAQHAKEEYPSEHVRTGATRDSIEATASGPSVTVRATTAYARFVPDAITTDYLDPINEAVRAAARGQ